MSAAYPGNSALPTEVRERVLATFRQTLDLYNQGALDDVIVGCDFLLKMDPLFDPAKKLREKAKNPAAPIDIQALSALASAGAPPPPAAPPAAPAPADLSEARAAFDARDYQRASDLASAVLRSDMLNEEAQQISEAASSRLEADPFIQQFASKARQQLQAGDAAAARATMEKARSLDPDHPLLTDVLREIDATPAALPFDPFSAFGAPQSGSSFGSSQPEQPAPAGFSSFVVDSSDPASRAGLAADLERLPREVPRTLVLNKVDRSGEAAGVQTAPDGTTHVSLSAASGDGLDGLRQHLKDCIGFHPSVDGALSARTRHLDALRRARAHVEQARDLLVGRHAGELVAQELRDAQQALGEITGEVSSDDLLGKIFASFCIGK